MQKICLVCSAAGAGAGAGGAAGGAARCQHII